MNPAGCALLDFCLDVDLERRQLHSFYSMIE